MDAVRVGIVGAFVMGGVALVAGLGHWVAVTTKAVAEGRGYDIRLADMLAIGVLPVAAGLVMLLGAWRGGADGLRVSGIGSGAFSLVIVLLWPALTAPPEGSTWGTAVGLVGFAGETLLAWWAT